MIISEDIYVSVTRDGYIKRISQRSMKASTNIPFGKKEDDILISLHHANTLNHVLLFTNKGNYLFVPVHKIEEFKWKELGIPYALEDVEPPTKEQVEHAREIIIPGYKS